MWLGFFACVVVLLLTLFVPSYFALRALGLGKTMSLGFAPVVCVTLFCTAGVVFHGIGIVSSAFLYSAILWVLCFAVLGVVAFGRRILSCAPELRCGVPSVSSGAKVLSVYLAFGVAVTVLVFLLPLDGPGSTVQTYDNVHHFGLIRSFVDSGSWCSIHRSLYMDSVSAAINPIPGEGYYPAAFHLLAAFLVSAIGCEVAVAANAVLFVFLAFVFPVEVFGLMRTLFGGDLRQVVFGAPFFMALPSFPWLLVDFWPLYPNTLSMILLPAVMVSFMVLLSRGAALRQRVLSAILLVVSLVSEVFVQPNGIFSAALFLIPFLVHTVVSEVSRRGSLQRPRFVAWIAGVGCSLACLAIWAMLAYAPFMRGVVGYYWSPILDLREAVVSVFGATFLFTGIMPVMTLALVVGIVFGALRPETRWIVCSFALASVVYVSAASLGDVWLKHFLSGFWYTDPYRVGAFASLCAVPIVALGAYRLCEFVSRLVSGVFRGKPDCSTFVFAAILSLFCFHPFASYSVGGPLFVLADSARASNDRFGYKPYDEAKREFVKEALALVDDEDVLLNHPYDGSLFAFGVDGANLYYRYMSGYDGVENGGELDASERIRLGVNGLSGDDEVARILSDNGIRYVLTLGATPEWSALMFPDYVEEEWVGIESVGDDTPGVSVVLSRGEMRLYEVDDSLRSAVWS